MTAAFLFLDFINDLVHPDGSVAGDGFYLEAERRGVLTNASRVLSHARDRRIPIFHVVFGFSEGFPEWHPTPKLFRRVPERGQVILGSWGTRIHDAVAPLPGESVVVKHRISPFLGTPLATLLRARSIDALYLAGVSTDFVILATALEAHDRDYSVTVLSDCVSSHDEHHHDAALSLIERVADLQTSDQLIDMEPFT